MKRCYRTSIATVQWLWTSLILCSVLQQQQLAECACVLKYQTWWGFDYYVKTIPSSVSAVTDVDGIAHSLDHSSYEYQYKWKNSSICRGSCDDQGAYFSAVGPNGVTLTNLHNELNVSPFHLCKAGTTASATKSARVYRRADENSAWVKAINADFSITVQDVASCACQDSLSQLDDSDPQGFLEGYASDTGTQLYIEDGA